MAILNGAGIITARINSRWENYRNICTAVMYNMAAVRLLVHLGVAEYGG